MPFAHPGHTSEGWANESNPLAGKFTLMDILSQRKLSLVVPKPPHLLEGEIVLNPPFEYPYRHLSTGVPSCSRTSWPRINSATQLGAASSFTNDHSLMAVLPHSVVQDIMWISKAASANLHYGVPRKLSPEYADINRPGWQQAWSRYYEQRPFPTPGGIQKTRHAPCRCHTFWDRQYEYSNSPRLRSTAFKRR